jgi:16S rRNA (guanine527-N7)-methyltransferase
VRSGGELVFLKGANVAAEVEAAARVIRKAHLVDVEVLTLGTELGTEATRVFRATVD